MTCDLSLLVAIDAFLESKRGEGRAAAGIRRYLTSRRAVALLDVTDPHLRVFLLAALTTGERPSELRALACGDASLGNGTLQVFRKKVGVGDAIPLCPRLAEDL